MSFGVCLFLQGVIRKYGGKAHTSGLHRDINVPHNFLSSRRLQKPRERTGGRSGPGAGRPPKSLGCPPSYSNQSASTSRIMLHRPKGSRKTVRSMSVWSNGLDSLEGTIKPDPLAPGDHTSSTESKLGFQFFIQVERIPLVLLVLPLVHLDLLLVHLVHVLVPLVLVLVSSSCNLENREREEESGGGAGSVGSSSTLYFCSIWFVLHRSPGSSIHNSWVL